MLITALVDGCSHTLESLDISDAYGTFARHLRPHLNSLLFVAHTSPASFDLSKATKLKDVVFRPGPWGVKRATTALQTITPEHRHLWQIAIHIPYYWTLAMLLAKVDGPTVEVRFERWLDLDRVLIQFWESRSIRPNLIPVAKPDAGDQIRYLLPEIMERGAIDLVGY